MNKLYGTKPIATPNSSQYITERERERERREKMGSEAKLRRDYEVPKLPLLAITAMESPDRSGMLTPPMYSSVSVPFRWEEEPGKPRFCFNSLNIPTQTQTQTYSLELPPRLLLMDPKISKLSPPIPSQKGFFQFHKHCCSSFRFDKTQLGAMVLRKRGVLIEKEWFCWLGKLSFRSKGEVGSDYGAVFPSSLDKEKSSSRMKVAVNQKGGSFSSCFVQAKTEFWGNIGEGFKQINIPWKSKRA
ncbi:uncharacterized protein At4g00950 isoform X2 [Cucumis sativus]|uniref:uncharacterized protein At4g00950 isoform X2 n=1 Tax=Cucumis sativus TaxID=3659 RepID=UPI0005ECB4BD|nr:uncharacterized protein At4g00950 isoform X2 [Cucumis sativus]